MINFSVWFLTGLTVVTSATPAAPGEGREARATAAVKALPPANAVVRDAQALADTIDQHLAAAWEAAKVKPAPVASDAEFLRRIYVDLAGRIPSVAEARRFLDDPRPDKRSKLIDQLLAGPRYPVHFTRVWRSVWLPEANTRFELTFFQIGFEGWLKTHLAKNTPYNQMAHELLTMPLAGETLQRLFSGDLGTNSPLAYYFAKESKPDELAAGASRLFLGVNLQCAQCHHHPFASWKKEQFWGIAAFFAGIEKTETEGIAIPNGEVFDRREIKIPNTEKIIPASFLDGTKPRFKENTSPRITLADWITSDTNPYFARAAVNRLWAYFFGTGLAEPVDDMISDESKVSHPALLDELARQFIAHRYDLKYLIRAITSTRAYQLTSADKDPTLADAKLFARMPLRGMSPEQLYDSVAQATGYQEPGNNNPYIAFDGGNRSRRAEFLTRFASLSERPTETQTSILHALALMNGKLIADATSVERSETLAAIIDAPFLDTAGRIQTLYLATLARLPRPEELERFTRYVDGGGSGGSNLVLRTLGMADRNNYNRALTDVFWVLLNSGEFILNH
jgi:hypothetical protein